MDTQNMYKSEKSSTHPHLLDSHSLGLGGVWTGPQRSRSELDGLVRPGDALLEPGQRVPLLCQSLGPTGDRPTRIHA